MYLQIKDVSKTIKQVPVLNQLSFSAEQGSITILCGHNGSGKTMLLRAIAGLIKIDSGQILIANQPVIMGTPLPVSVGVIIETPGFINDYTGRQNLEFLTAINHKPDPKRISQVLQEVGLGQAQEIKVKKYSLGMRQRLAIAQAYMDDQQLLLLDEPTNALDPDGIRDFNQIMRSLREQGQTIIIATHDEREIAEIADHVIKMSDGQVVINHD